MMEYNQIAKQMIDLQKTAFTNGYDLMAMIQDQAASATEAMMSQASLVPEDGRKAVKRWINACQEERDRFKSYVDAGFASLEKHFATERQGTPAKSAAGK
ncbi:conserved hypothetical protein [Desulfosarcina cetonica]|uniref:hypothetical protein n=1 Tax=Desulfosarcina cetonica TaxID=90730 RepID=UPI0006D228AC|nr:hypothetical protein [Desulfosarcina cetonica]VTR64275.1 conserved hypothetical protein [Desulfosarcina cetonica]